MIGRNAILFDAVCIRVPFDGAQITVGKSYGVRRVAEAEGEAHRWFLILADNGNPGSYRDDCFAPVSEAGVRAMGVPKPPGPPDADWIGAYLQQADAA